MDTKTGRTACENEGADQGEISIRQGAPRVPANREVAGAGKEAKDTRSHGPHKKPMLLSPGCQTCAFQSHMPREVPMCRPPGVWHLVMAAPENRHSLPSQCDWPRSSTWLLWLRARVGLGIRHSGPTGFPSSDPPPHDRPASLSRTPFLPTLLSHSSSQAPRQLPLRKSSSALSAPSCYLPTF